jgi:hypothetical protein
MQAIEAEAKMDSGIAARFGILKQRLLLQRLNEVPDSRTPDIGISISCILAGF